LKEGRVLAIDYGEVRVGVAISDPLRIFAFPLLVIDLRKTEDCIKEIQKIVIDKDIKKIIIGLPLQLDGKEGIQSGKVREFYREIKENIQNVDIELVDERLTTTSAQKTLTNIGLSIKKQRGVVDKIAAAKLLEMYLEREKRR